MFMDFVGNLEIQNLTTFGSLDVVGLEDGLMVYDGINMCYFYLILSSASWVNTNPIYLKSENLQFQYLLKAVASRLPGNSAKVRGKWPFAMRSVVLFEISLYRCI